MAATGQTRLAIPETPFSERVSQVLGSLGTVLVALVLLFFVAFRCRDAKKLVAALERRQVVASYRPPDIVRFGLSPLYHREADVRALARRLRSLR